MGARGFELGLLRLFRPAGVVLLALVSGALAPAVFVVALWQHAFQRTPPGWVLVSGSLFGFSVTAAFLVGALAAGVLLAGGWSGGRRLTHVLAWGWSSGWVASAVWAWFHVRSFGRYGMLLLVIALGVSALAAGRSLARAGLSGRRALTAVLAAVLLGAALSLGAYWATDRWVGSRSKTFPDAVTLRRGF